jgi:hypothetical protein
MHCRTGEQDQLTFSNASQCDSEGTDEFTGIFSSLLISITYKQSRHDSEGNRLHKGLKSCVVLICRRQQVGHGLELLKALHSQVHVLHGKQKKGIHYQEGCESHLRLGKSRRGCSVVALSQRELLGFSGTR